MRRPAADFQAGINPAAGIAALPGAIHRAGLSELDAGMLERFRVYLELLLKWNARMNLTAVRDASEIVERHFLECIAVAQVLPESIETLLDFGSGAGFPGMPIAICRPEIAVVLAESQGKKAAFLQEAVRVLDVKARVFAARAEGLTERFDCVAFRAVDRMTAAVSSGVGLTRLGGFLAVMTTTSGAPALMQVAGKGFIWREPMALPGAQNRILLLGHRSHGE